MFILTDVYLFIYLLCFLCCCFTHLHCSKPCYIWVRLSDCLMATVACTCEEHAVILICMFYSHSCIIVLLSFTFISCSVSRFSKVKEVTVMQEWWFWHERAGVKEHCLFYQESVDGSRKAEAVGDFTQFGGHCFEFSSVFLVGWQKGPAKLVPIIPRCSLLEHIGASV